MMNKNNEETSVYGLMTELCRRFVEKHKPVEHPYLPQKDVSGKLKKMRSRAFEILLKKSPSRLEDDKHQNADPVAELLKYSFVLKNALRRFSHSAELEKSLDQLSIDEEDLDDGVYSVLRFLNGLKSFEINDESTLDVFHYGRANPFLPEQPKNSKEVPRYQVYPVESFLAPDRFEAILGIDGGFKSAENSTASRECIPLERQLKSATTIGIETLSTRSERTIGSMLSAPRYTVRLVSTNEFSVSSYFIPPIIDDIDDEKSDYPTNRIGYFPEPEPPWVCVKSAMKNYDSNSEVSDGESTNAAYDVKSRTFDDTRLEIWDNIDDTTDLTDHRTWENLGRCYEAPKEPPFVSETNETMLHFERIMQAGFLFLLPNNVVDSLNMIEEVDTGIFMGNIKLLLLGIESSTFVWDDKMGFRLVSNITISGLSVEAVNSACQEITHWGDCYKSLCKLIKPDPQTGKMQQEGLIFRAMCNSVKELLMYYQAVILRITVEKKGLQGLLRLLNNVRPVGSLIAEVARLCRCDRDNCETLGEGLGILSHIYDQVTKITKPRVALVFYSILKSCCEVYFRLLEKWLFEGICDDQYGEFMIKVRPQYARERGHHFWTKAFAINKNSVPGFIGSIVESILECGKTVRLLKICDRKNSLTDIFENSHPTVRVCLSMGMVREQELLCRDFIDRGEKLLGPNASFHVAFEEQKRVERERVELVINAQRDTLLRIKREREEFKIEEARNKREFLAQLKDQAEEVAMRKEREKEAEMLKDREYLDYMNAADELAKNATIADKKSTLDYYNELGLEIERRRARADWCLKRMKLFQERANFLNRTQRENEEISGKTVECPREDSEITKKEDNTLLNVKSSDELTSVSIVSEDFNKNSTKLTENVATIFAKKSPRPCVLDIKKTTINREITWTNNNVSHDDRSDNENLSNKTERTSAMRIDETGNNADSQRNKLKVLQQEYGMTPNNNEFNIIVVDAEGNENTISLDASTLDNENARKNREAETNKNRNGNTRETELIESRRNENVIVAKSRNENSASVSCEERLNLPENIKVDEMTEAEKNRKRNMSRTCNDENLEKVHLFRSTDLQINRARVMGCDNRNYRDYYENDGTNVTDCLNSVTQAASQLTDCQNGVTPMSCTTDTFPTSTTDSSVQLHNWDDCPKSSSRTNVVTPSDTNFVNDPSTRTFSHDFRLRDNSYSKFFGLEAAATPIFESSLTLNDVEMIDNTSLQVYLEKSVAMPLRVQSRLANAAIIKYLIYDCNMLSHLRSLRSFYFLLNGEFAKTLTSSLYQRLYEISVPIELFKTSTLQHFLEQAVNSSLSGSYENSDCLSLSANDVPLQLQLSNPEYLNCLSFNYKISWPLNIIIDEKILQQYGKVFKFLLMVGRVLYVLQRDFHILKLERKATISSQYHKLQLYRHSMMQFVTALHNYLTCSVLHESWTEFERELVNATTIDEIYLAHVSYLKKILSRCMLTSRGEKMRTFLSNIFKVILKFHNRVRSQCWSTGSRVYTQANFDRLENMYRTFCDARTYLAHVAEKLASSGYQPHLSHFLNALNINPRYDLTDMPGSKRT